MILGVDPGLRHTGIVVLADDGKVVFRTTVGPTRKGKLRVGEVLGVVLTTLAGLVTGPWRITRAGVEEVTWYGKGRRITLPLSHIAGGIAGYLLAAGIPVTLLLAGMRSPERRPPLRSTKGWTEHELDAWQIARTVQRFLDVNGVKDASGRKRQQAMRARTTTIPSARGKS